MSDAEGLNGIWNAIARAGANPQMAARDADNLRRCVDVLSRNETRNRTLELWYEGNMPLTRVPDFVPDKYRSMRFGCPWPEVAVQSVVERSQMDGFVFRSADSELSDRMEEISRRCDVALGYSAALTDCLVYGVSFATVVREETGGAGLRWHSARSAAALWDFAHNRVECGLAIVGRRYRRGEADATEPSEVDFYTTDGMWELTRGRGRTWAAEWRPDGLGRPRMVALRFRPDGRHPLGRSRISPTMRDIAREYMCNALNIHVASEYTAVGQKWVTNLSDEQLAAFSEQKWKFSGDSVVMATDNADGGGAPQFGSFAQQSMEPLLSVKRSLATDFAAVASIPISEIMSADSNPTSAEALAAAKDKLISLVSAMNLRNKSTLREVGLMLLAVETNRTLGELTDEERTLMVNFRNPSTPSPATMADSALKMAQTIEGFGGTDVCQEMLGFDEGQRARIGQQLTDGAARQALVAALGGQ